MTNTTEISNQNEIKEPESWECAYNDNAKCPYCGHDNEVEVCDFDPRTGCEKQECSECERTFIVTEDISVKYSTIKLEDFDAESK